MKELSQKYDIKIAGVGDWLKYEPKDIFGIAHIQVMDMPNDQPLKLRCEIKVRDNANMAAESGKAPFKWVMVLEDALDDDAKQMLYSQYLTS